MDMDIGEKAQRLVRDNVIYCVSGLIYDLRSVAEQLDDYDTYLNLVSGRPDYEQAASEFVTEDADLDQLEEIADNFGYWADVVLESVGYDFTEPPEVDEEEVDFDDYLDADPKRWETLRHAVWKLVDDFAWVCNHYALDPDCLEVYEHWIVSSWFGEKLKDKGEVVEGYMGLTVWGRTCTGQAIVMDELIQQIAKELWYAYR